jgi:hypothetical protein
MLQYKSIPFQLSVIKAKAKDINTLETAQIAVAPYAQAIENEARGGWALHSLTLIRARVESKVGCLAALLGKKKKVENPEYYIAVFVKES